MGWLKRWLPKKRWKRVALYAANTFLMAAAVDMGLVQYWRRIEISPETTGIVGPLNAAGTPDYIKALNEKYGRGVTEENNAAGLLLKSRNLAAPGLTAEERNSPLVAVIANFPRWVYESADKTGMPTDDEANEQYAAMQRGPWKGAEHPVWARWLEAQAKDLAEARRAVERAKLYVPLTPKQERPGDAGAVLGSPFSYMLIYELKSIVFSLVSDGMRRVGESDAAGFREDMVAALKLARLVGNGQTIGDLLTGQAIEANVMRAVRAAVLTPGALPAEECRKLLAEMEAPVPMPALVELADCQIRWTVLDNLSAIAWEGLGNYDARHRHDEDRIVLDLPLPSWCFKAAFLFVPVNYNAQMRQANALVDEFVADLRLPTFAGRRAALDVLERRYNREVNLLTDSRHLYYAAMVSTGKADAMAAKFRTEGDLARMALALAVYRSERGEYPEKLETLKAVRILREIPLDGFSDAPLVYERHGAGYVLYSVGYKTFGDNGSGEVQKGYQGYAWRVVHVEH